MGEAIKEIYGAQQELAGQRGNIAESNVNFRRDIDQLSLPPGTQKGQYYYTDPNTGKVLGGLLTGQLSRKIYLNTIGSSETQVLRNYDKDIDMMTFGR